jgi:hypothetical protein
MLQGLAGYDRDNLEAGSLLNRLSLAEHRNDGRYGNEYSWKQNAALHNGS